MTRNLANIASTGGEGADGCDGEALRRLAGLVVAIVRLFFGTSVGMGGFTVAIIEFVGGQRLLPTSISHAAWVSEKRRAIVLRSV
jgi:hypothetical protein